MGLQTIQSGSFNIQKSPSGVTENATTTRANVLDLNCLTNINYVRICDTIFLC